MILLGQFPQVTALRPAVIISNYRLKARGSPWPTVNALAFAPDGRTLATASTDKTVLLWDVTDPARPRRLGDPLIGHTAALRSIAFAPDGRTLATASYDQTALLWDVTDPTR